MRKWSMRARVAGWTALWLLIPSKLRAQRTGPWEEAMSVLLELFGGVIFRSLWLAAFVIGGLMLAFSGAGWTRALAWRVIVLGLVILGVNGLAFLLR